MGSLTRVGGHAFKDEIRAHDGGVALGGDLVERTGVPCIDEVDIVEIARAGDELL